MLQAMMHLSTVRPCELVIRNVPPHVLRRLRMRAESNQRTLQDELYAILEAAVSPDDNNVAGGPQ